MPRPSLDEIFGQQDLWNSPPPSSGEGDMLQSDSQDRPSLDSIFADTSPKQPESPKDESFLGTMWENAKAGASALGDFATLNYKDSKDLPMLQTLKQKRATGTAGRHDYERAFLESAGNNPGGKILQAAGGLIPEANLVGTSINNYANPAITKATGIDPSELQLLEMAAPFGVKGAMNLKNKITPRAVAQNIGEAGITSITGDTKNGGPPDGGGPGGGFTPASLPSVRAATATTKAVTYPIRHPLKTTGFVVNTATKAITPIVRPVARSIIEGDNPITGEPGLNAALASQTAVEGTRLGQKMGIDFSAGELTGNPTARGIEDALANSARWGGKFAEANQRKVDAVIGRYNETLDKIHPQGNSQAHVGDRLTFAYNSTIDSIVKARRQQAAVDAEAAGIATRGKAVIDPNNFVKTLADYIEEGKSPTATPAQREASSQASKLLNNLKESSPKQSTILDQYGQPIKAAPAPTKYKKITVRDLQNGLAAFGEGAKAGGGIWKSLSTASDRRFSLAAKDALLSDMDAAIQSGGSEASALKTFRDNYKSASNKIADIQTTTLGKLVGGAERNSAGELVLSPEKVADRFTAMEPTELRNTLSFLDKNHPDVAQMARRYTLERALKKALEGRGLRGEGTAKEFGKAEFVKNLPSRETLNALLKDPRAANDITDVAAAMNRMIDYGAQRKGSQTFQRGNFMGAIAQWSKGALYRSIVSDTLAEDLLNPQKRMQIGAEARKINFAKPSAKPPAKAVNQ